MTRPGFGALPFMLARPMKSLGPELPQKANCELTATPQTVAPAGAAFGMKSLFGLPPPIGARPTDLLVEPQ